MRFDVFLAATLAAHMVVEVGQPHLAHNNHAVVMAQEQMGASPGNNSTTAHFGLGIGAGNGNQTSSVR